jgi:hypothetical protein
MIPSKAIAAVASSALRNYRGVKISSCGRWNGKKYLDEGIVLFVIALDCQDRVTRCTCTNAHFDHLAIEKVGKVLFIHVWRDASNIEATRLAGQVGVAAYTHSEALDR